MESVLGLFSSGNFMPHGHCYYWEPYLLWSHALSDSIIALAYLSIPLTLLYIYLKRKRDFRYLWMALLFAIFILGCGMTHVFDVITIWNPLYYADSVVRIVTACASIGTALVLIRITPELLLLPSSEQWAKAQATLRSQMQELEEKDRIISVSNAELSYRLEQLFAAQELSQVGSYETDYGQGSFTGTPELYRIFGWPVELAGQPTDLSLFYQAVHPDDVGWVREKAREAMKKGEAYAFRYRILLPDGSMKYILVQARMVSDASQGMLTRGTVMDITRQHEQELRLQRLNEELTATNEELQMAQEELVAANEELATANEELQAANEQILATNEELEGRVTERTEALRQSEERYRVFVEQSSEGISRFELEHIGSLPVDLPEAEQLELFGRYGFLAECNDSMAKMYGYRSAGELIGTKLVDFLPPSLPANVDYFTRFVRSGYRLSGAETMELDQNGNPKYFLNNLFGVVEGSRLLRVWCTQRDITAEKEARQALQQSEAQLRLLTDALPVSIVYVDKHIRYQFANRTAFQWRQGQQESIIGKPVVEVVGQQTYQSVAAYVEQALQGEYVQFEREIQYPTGKRYTQSQYVPHLEDGEVQGFYGLVTDVSAQVEARKEADRQRQRLNDLFMSAPAAICILSGAELVFELVNPAYGQLLPGRSLLGKPLLEALPELAGTPTLQTFYQVFQTGQTHEEKEILLSLARHDDSSLEDRYFRYIQQARYDWEGKTDGVVVFALEVTEQVMARKQVEQSEWQLQRVNQQLAVSNQELQMANQELAETNRQLIRINHDLDNFVYTASHDLKAPILNIEGLLRALEKQLSREAQQNQTLVQIYGFLYDSVNRFKITIQDLTEVARISKESIEDAASIQIGTLLAEVLTDLAPQIEEAGAGVEVKLDCPAIHFSRKNLKSILYNLLGNAVKYRSPDRELRVRIACREEEAYCVLTVEDNGLGMDMRQEDKIFALFKRLHNHVEGTGIGLYIVKRMLENAGGKIEVKSQVGVGSTFSAYFKR